MIRRHGIWAALLILAWGLWINPDLKIIAGGIALFLFGMVCLEQGFKALAGGLLEQGLRRSTDRLWKSIGFGIATTSLTQSSTLVSLITISFVSAEMIKLAAGIGIIMGANLGTTTGAWLIAAVGLRVDMAAYALPALVFGVVLALQKRLTRRGLGYIILGIGFLFFGIAYIKMGFDTFQDGWDLSQYMVPGLLGVLIFTGIGMAMTVVMQSSHATLLVIIAALASGQVSYEAALGMAIGANLGSAVTTAIGGLTANLAGKRLALAHVLFNVLTAAVAIALIQQMVWLVDYLAGFLGIEEDLLFQLALFHTLFNVLGVLMLAPFVGLIDRLLIRYVQFDSPNRAKPRYLYPGALETPAAAVSALNKEVSHLYDNAHDLIAHGVSLRRATIASKDSLEEAVRSTRRIISLDVDDEYESKVKSLHNAIIAFISEIQGQALSENDGARIFALQQASRDIVEAVKATKHLHKNLIQYGVTSQPAARHAYDRIRLQIAQILREIAAVRAQESETVTRLSLDAFKINVENFAKNLTAQINQNVRMRALSPAVATSILNDEKYAVEICLNLLDAAAALLQPESAQERAAEGALALDEKDRAQISTAREAVDHGDPKSTG